MKLLDQEQTEALLLSTDSLASAQFEKEHGSLQFSKYGCNEIRIKNHQCHIGGKHN